MHTLNNINILSFSFGIFFHICPMNKDFSQDISSLELVFQLFPTLLLCSMYYEARVSDIMLQYHQF